jgi:hypothetical protein
VLAVIDVTGLLAGERHVAAGLFEAKLGVPQFEVFVIV